MEEDTVLLGVGLTCESGRANQSKDLHLGVLRIPTWNYALNQLRILMQNDTKDLSLPDAFQFISKEGWKISTLDEAYCKCKDVFTKYSGIRIEHIFDKPRIGLKKMDGVACGFIHADLVLSASEFREQVLLQLEDSLYSLVGTNFQIIDRNGWPINESQEKDLTLMDLVVDSVVRICVKPHRIVQSIKSPIQLDSTDFVLKDSSHKRLRPNQLTFRSGKDLDRSRILPQITPGQAKQVLLSYVRAEAAQYALQLKEVLSRNGYSVYLDVHEIKSGIDWQDSLNFAVTNCQVFVPLVTPRYGETQWTNREVKLADVLQKLIIPVSFLDSWPPRCLAIQFATTQYIPWHAPECSRLTQEAHNDGESHVSNMEWDETDIEEVAKKIMSQCSNYELCNKTEEETPMQRKKLSRQRSLLQSYTSRLPEGWIDVKNHHIQGEEEIMKIVVSLHPDNQDFGDRMKTILHAKGCQVWCSTELSVSEAMEVDEPSSPAESLSASPIFSSDCCDNCGGSICLTQSSQQFSMTDINEKGRQRRMSKHFQAKVDEAHLVIFALSKSFSGSKLCKEQVFYCEQRKHVIPVRLEDFRMPGWMSMLIGTGVFEDANSKNFEQSLSHRLDEERDRRKKGISSAEDKNEERISAQVQELRQKIPKQTYVYIAGSTTFYDSKSEEICRAIGMKLAGLDNIHLVTGGFYGVGATVGRGYDEEIKRLEKDDPVRHILPLCDPQDRSGQAKQNSDLTFQDVDFGETIRCGQNVREREIIVSRVFDICILIEGGPGAAHEAEQFAWNDHVVIPIRCTGGAASGKFNVPEKIFTTPHGVAEADWKVLTSRSSTLENIRDVIGNVVLAIKQRLMLDSPAIQSAPLSSPLTNSSLSSRPTYQRVNSSGMPSTSPGGSTRFSRQNSRIGRMNSLTDFNENDMINPFDFTSTDRPHAFVFEGQYSDHSPISPAPTHKSSLKRKMSKGLSKAKTVIIHEENSSPHL